MAKSAKQLAEERARKAQKEEGIRLVRQEVLELSFPLLEPGNLDSSEAKKLKFDSKRDLYRALAECVNGDVIPVIAFYYDKDESGGPGRVANEDYLPIPGMEDNFHFGQMIQVRRSNRGNVYFKMRDLSRADGTSSWAWTCVRPDRITRFQYRGSFSNPDKRTYQEQKT